MRREAAESRARAAAAREQVAAMTAASRRRQDYLDGHTDGAVSALLGGGEPLTLFGRRVRVRLEWEDPPPPDDFLARRREAALLRADERLAP